MGSESPRERARNLASRACLAFGRVLLLVVVVEVAAAVVRALFDPEAAPAVLGHLAAVARALYAGLALWTARGLLPYARALGVRAFAAAATALFLLAVVLALLPLFALVPARLSDATWDALLQIVRAVCFVAGACLVLLVARAFAGRESQPLYARHLTWTTLPLLVCLPIAFQAVDPGLAPSPWIAPALALALPWAMVAVGLMRWDVGAWVTLALLGVGGMVLFGQTPGPLALPGIALAGALVLAAIAAGGALSELAPSLAARDGGSVSRTLIRRLFDGTLGGEASRVGDVSPESGRPPPDEQDEDAENLARALRELGIEAGSRAVAPPDGVEAAPVEVPAVIAPFVPKRAPAPAPGPAEGDDGRLAPVVMLPGALGAVDGGLRWCFGAFIARALVVVFGWMWSSSPLAELMPLVVLFDLALLASGAAFAIGLHQIRRSPLPALRTPATAAFATAVALVGCDLVLAVARHGPGIDRSLVTVADGLFGVAAVAGYLVVAMRLFAHLGQDRLRGRARGSLVLLVVWAVLGAGALGARHLPASDLQWLSWPLGFATAAVGLGLWIALLWLTRDAQEALRT